MGLLLSSLQSTAPGHDAPSTQARRQGGGERSALPSLPLSSKRWVTWRGLLYSLSVDRKPFPVFGSSPRLLVLSLGEGRKYTGTLTPHALLPGTEALYAGGEAAALALSLSNEERALPPILAPFFTNKSGDLGQVFEPLSVFSLLMCGTVIIISAFPTLQDYSKDQIA